MTTYTHKLDKGRRGKEEEEKEKEDLQSGDEGIAKHLVVVLVRSENLVLSSYKYDHKLHGSLNVNRNHICVLQLLLHATHA